ncbi:MAG: ribonuclease III [Candidatus Blackburnbacteria bacterium RIFCSPHIGHO2_01_FULL_43_15b]|uniref:Ribonuclease 3 n=1 Tax=Candidatus Blackburnbacteria bacterium RIFCSPHIGHO2_01_FULL_43_15b TaxID=1797513 RepID=A0A1G1UXH6_9BACT|nr:MAG: ribonuclease III [Candidatus Blackburnbacteria bacterium RIFCSPHIGHO2_01_FULL_43_15b]
MTTEPQVEERVGITFKDKSCLHRAFIHRSYLNENKVETESNERLEFLGDAVLEFIVSNNLFVHFPNLDEGHLTALRSKLVNTTSLAETARELDLGSALYLSRGEEQSGGRTNTGLLANTVEALLGAIFLDQGVDGAREFVDRFILSKVPQTVKESLKDPKSMLQEFVQAKGLPAPSYKVIAESGPDHAKEFTIEVWIDKKSYAAGKGNSKKAATQDAAGKALDLWKKSSEK